MLEIVTTLPAVEITNINDVTEKVDQYLQKYSLIVSVDDVPVAKKMVTEINSIIKEIDNARKSKVQELQAPIKMFEMQIRDLSDMCTQKKNELQGQIKVFEDQKKVEIRTLLDEELRVLYLKHGVDTEYQTSNTSDLVILSNINPKGGTLTKKAKDTLVERVLANKQWQDKINKRLELLPTLSIQYGLKSAMTRFDVEYFLKWESDEQFQEKLTTSFKRAAEKEQEIIPAPPQIGRAHV